MNVFNRSVDTFNSEAINWDSTTFKLSSYQTTYSGKWRHIVSSNNSLGCSLVLNQDTRTIGLLKWNNNSLSMLGNLSLNYFNSVDNGAL